MEIDAEKSELATSRRAFPSPPRARRSARRGSTSHGPDHGQRHGKNDRPGRPDHQRKRMITAACLGCRTSPCWESVPLRPSTAGPSYYHHDAARRRTQRGQHQAGEAARMSWCLADVNKIHGPTGLVRRRQRRVPGGRRRGGLPGHQPGRPQARRVLARTGSAGSAAAVAEPPAVAHAGGAADGTFGSAAGYRGRSLALRSRNER